MGNRIQNQKEVEVPARDQEIACPEMWKPGRKTRVEFLKVVQMDQLSSGNPNSRHPHELGGKHFVLGERFRYRDLVEDPTVVKDVQKCPFSKWSSNGRPGRCFHDKSPVSRPEPAALGRLDRMMSHSGKRPHHCAAPVSFGQAFLLKLNYDASLGQGLGTVNSDVPVATRDRMLRLIPVPAYRHAQPEEDEHS